MRDYVVRRAREVKQYKRMAKLIGVGEFWLQKLSTAKSIPNPGAEDIEKCYYFYKGLESDHPPRRNGHRKSVPA